MRRVDPTATFQVMAGDDPTGIYVIATVDVEGTKTVIDGYIGRLLEFQIDEGLPVYVRPSALAYTCTRALGREGYEGPVRVLVSRPGRPAAWSVKHDGAAISLHASRRTTPTRGPRG